MFYSFTKFVNAVQSITSQIKLHEKRMGKVDVIVSLARGGTVLGTTLSHNLNVTDVMYCYPKQADECILKLQDIILNTNKNILIVDDVFDSGDTINDFITNILNFKPTEYTPPLQVLDSRINIAVLLANEDRLEILSKHGIIISVFTNNIFSRKTMKEWITFFWECISINEQ